MAVDSGPGLVTVGMPSDTRQAEGPLDCIMRHGVLDQKMLHSPSVEDRRNASEAAEDQHPACVSESRAGGGQGEMAIARDSLTQITQTQPALTQVPAQQFGQDVHAVLTPLTSVGTTFEWKELDELLIGRHPDCHMCLDSCKQVSGQHVRIRREAGNYYVDALSGQNPTFVDKQKMTKGDTRMLRHKDIISLVQAFVDRATAMSNNPILPAFEFKIVSQQEEVSNGVLAIESPRGKEVVVQGDSPHSKHNYRTVQWLQENWDMDMDKPLGSGTFSQVRLGVEVKGGHKRAIKVMEKKRFYQFQSKRNTELPLTSEAEVLTKLQHPGIVKFFDWFQTDTHLLLVMELMEAGDLLQCIMEDGYFLEPQAKRVFKQLCDAVGYLHAQDIVHRDLKPENILLTSRDRDTMHLKVTDFGLAKSGASNSKYCRTFCGTPHYFAPEVITSCPKDGESPKEVGYGKPADMWSLGVILYILLCGMPPFEEDGLYEQILQGKYEFDAPMWQGISEDVKELIRKLMTVNPKDRLEINETIGHNWLCDDNARRRGLDSAVLDSNDDPSAYRKALNKNASESSTTTASSVKRPCHTMVEPLAKRRRSTQAQGEDSLATV